VSIDFYGTDHAHRDPRAPEFPAALHLEDDDPRQLNWNVGNAAALWPLLGLPAHGGEVPQHGEVPIPDARRALVRARALFDREAPRLARPAKLEHGGPRRREDGAIELRPLRAFSARLDVEGIARRVDAFARFVEAIGERGATHIAWS
jgi:hypothetical protein